MLEGGEGDDYITGGGGADVIDAGAGNDTVSGGAGADNLRGGSGADRFVDSALDFNGDELTDFSTADLIEISGVRFADVRYTPASGLLELDTGNDGGYATDLALPQNVSGAFRAAPSAASESAYTRVWLVPDTDGDGFADDEDNAVLVPNANQRDTDGDGYGNVVDSDLNNDLFVNALDLSLFMARFATPEANADFNGDGFVNALDLSMFLGMFGKAPGPSFIDESGAAPASLQASMDLGVEVEVAGQLAAGSEAEWMFF